MKKIKRFFKKLFNDTVEWIYKTFFFLLQTFRHGFPHQPTAVAFDPVQKLLAIGTKTGSLRMYPF